MKIGVTGASGFVGARLVRRHLERGDEVRALSRRADPGFPAGVVAHRADLASGPDEALREFARGLDVLYHCAGELKREELMRPLHVEGTKRLVAAAAGSVRRWVQLSSIGAYGDMGGVAVADESVPESPRGLYEETKTISDGLVRAAASDKKFAAVLLRPSAVIGPEMPNQSVFQLLRAIHAGRFFFIGPENAVRNYVHVDDLVAALMLAGERPEANGRVYNVARNCTIEQVAEWACEAFGRPCDFRRLPKWPFALTVPVLQYLPGFPLTSGRLEALTHRTFVSSASIERDLGFAFSVDLRAAIRELAERILKEDE